MKYGDGAKNKNPTLFQASPAGKGDVRLVFYFVPQENISQSSRLDYLLERGMSDLFCTPSLAECKKSIRDRECLVHCWSIFL